MASKYHNTLVVASELIILLGEMWKFSNNSVYKEQNFVKDNREYLEYPRILFKIFMFGSWDDEVP
jgi:hypothetical protein